VQEFSLPIFAVGLQDGTTPEDEVLCKARGIGELYGSGKAFRYDYGERVAGNFGARVASFCEAIAADNEKDEVDRRWTSLFRALQPYPFLFK
jgi:hypothetical protein